MESESVKQQLDRLIEKSFPNIPDFLKIVNVRFEKLENAKSFWSEIYIAHLQKMNDEEIEDLPKNVFIKIPKVTDNVKRCSEEDKDAGNYDILQFYSQKEDIFYRSFKNATVPLFPLPKMYYSEEITGSMTGGLVLENLKGEVYSVNHLPGLSHEQVLRLMEAYAGLHYYTQNIDDDSFFDGFREQAGFEVFSVSMQNTMFDMCMKLESICPQLFGNGRIQKLAKIFDYDYKNEVYAEFINKRPKILAHNDSNCTNLLWKKGGKSDDLRAIIDFQLINQGSLAIDIARVLSLGITRGQRTTNTDRYLKHYHDTVSKLFDGHPPYTFEEVKSEYEKILAIAACFTLFGATIFYDMCKSGEFEDEKNKEKNCQELLSRILGMVEDMEEHLRNY